MKTKTCPSCTLTLEESCFYKSTRAKSGLQTYCKQCLYARVKAAITPEQNRQKAASYYARNREKVLAQKRARYKALTDEGKQHLKQHLKQIKKKSYIKHRDKNLQGFKTWREINQDHVRAYARGYWAGLRRGRREVAKRELAEEIALARQEIRQADAEARQNNHL